MNTTSRKEVDPRSITASRSPGCIRSSVLAAPEDSAGRGRSAAPGPLHRARGGGERLLRAADVLVDQREADRGGGVHDAVADVDPAGRNHPSDHLRDDGEPLLVDV